MDLIRTGQFICALRKEQGLTQEQLGERLGVTNKTISRWETGTYLPPAEMLLEMSGLFGVSINELLSGRRLSDEEYRQAAEENLQQTIRAGSFSLKERIAFYKRKWLREHAAVMILAGLCIAGLLAAGILLRKPFPAAAAVLLFLPAHGWRHNAMMAYVERNAFDGSGPD